MDSIQDIDLFLSVMDFGHDRPLKIVDIGAHEGRFTAAIKQRYPTAKSFMFEPSPEQFETLVTKFPDDFVFNYGISDTFKKSKFVLYGDGLSQLNRATQAVEVDPINTLIEVQMISLDRLHGSVFNGMNIDICKIDTEGQELNVFKGAIEMLKNKAVQYCIFECGGTWEDLGVKFTDVNELLYEYGYHIYQFKNGKPVKVPADFSDYSLCDYLATYKEL